jgi:broad specificity phosphatase PhoE
MKTPTKPNTPAPMVGAVGNVRTPPPAPPLDPDVRRLAVALRDGLRDVAFGPDLARARETVAASIFAAKG